MREYLKKSRIQLKNRKDIIIFAIVMISFTLTMLHNLMHSALWGDEWVEYRYSQAAIGTGDLYQRVISTFQPPLYNFVMHFWLKIGQSVLWFRLYNVIIGFLGGLLLFFTVKKICSKYAAYIAVISLAVCYQWIYCVQECSEYATMLFFLFVAIWIYVECNERFAYSKMLLFIIACVCAIYSQYGSVFVVLPLLALFYIKNMIDKNVNKKQKIVVNFSYIVSFFAFGIPLYVFFLRKQMENNQISSNTIPMSFEFCKDLFLTLGRILCYFFNLNSYISNKWTWIGGAFTIVLLLITVFLLAKGKLGWTKSSLILTVWIGYVIHYFLVQLHIYAMVHPNQSAGFYARYSYFYIPILSVVLTIMFYELYRIQLPFNHKKVLLLFCIPGILCLFISFYTLNENWYKAKDNLYAQIWLENNGWEDTTYLFGMASYGFNYYISHSDEYQEGYLDNATTSVDINNLPLKFWAWRTNWGGDAWQTVVETAEALGYNVTILDDSGYTGQLAYCIYDIEQQPLEELMSDTINPSIENAEFNDEGILQFQIKVCDRNLYNVNSYRLSYHVLDLEGNILIWDNARTDLDTITKTDAYSCEFDPSVLEDTQNYIIVIDFVHEGVSWISQEKDINIMLSIVDGLIQ